MIIIPPYLERGDVIGIVCPSGYMPFEKAQTCISTLQQWGFGVKAGSTLGNQYHYFSGTDDERLQDFQQMLDDNTVKAILCARGGYGLSRIIDGIDFTGFIKNPKWIIGYSDVTVLHAHLYSVCNIASLHAPMAAAFKDDATNPFIQSVYDALTGIKANYSCNCHSRNRKGSAVAGLTGGNLSLIAHVTGTVSDIDTSGKLLFLEDVGEYYYNVDRMLIQLKRSGKLQNLAGLIIGGFTEMKDTAIPFGQEIYDLIFNKVAAYNYPVSFDFPVSHTERNYALKIGVEYELTVGEETTTLIEK